MASIVLRVSGPVLDVEECLSRLPQLPREACYRAGEVGLLKRIHTKSGFVLTLADDDDDRAAVALAERRLNTIGPQLAELLKDGATAELDCGLFVDGSRFEESARFVPTFLKVLAELGIELVMTAYPCSDDDDDDETSGAET